ncbi:hypothetical protein Dda_3613 [Drechslerella dactyloides]|uniref:Uncharacterized protein n=1 Tax=Drechslerella dactyloides TaxID=74499 RepID=A0AAD6J2R9_DREDA|nr:hypothetical protein Dda_3613 [Drechslerella dactyloides]
MLGWVRLSRGSVAIDVDTQLYQLLCQAPQQNGGSSRTTAAAGQQQQQQQQRLDSGGGSRQEDKAQPNSKTRRQQAVKFNSSGLDDMIQPVDGGGCEM